MFGIVSVPALRTVITQVRALRELLALREAGAHDLDREIALGLVLVLPLAAAAAGHGDDAGERDRPACVLLLASKAGRTYHRIPRMGPSSLAPLSLAARRDMP